VIVLDVVDAVAVDSLAAEVEALVGEINGFSAVFRGRWSASALLGRDHDSKSEYMGSVLTLLLVAALLHGGVVTFEEIVVHKTANVPV
jgi:hypothetical protein